MLKNYLLTAFRSFSRHRVYTIINLGGLTAGLSCFIIIGLYIYNELRFDSHHRDVDRLYRITSLFVKDSEVENSATNAMPVIPGLKDAFPEVEAAFRIAPQLNSDRMSVQYGEKKLYLEKTLLADSTLFTELTYMFVEGDPATCLSHPNNIVLSKRAAHKIFGEESALGKRLQLSGGFTQGDFIISGVVDLAYYPTHIAPDIFFAINSPGYGDFLMERDSWVIQNLSYGFIKLSEHAEPAEFEVKMNELLAERGAAQFEEFGFKKKMELQPFKDIHLNPDYQYELSFTSQGNRGLLYLLAVIAVFLLFIGCINFINLSTAKGTLRFKEIGVRKAIGADRYNLTFQFLAETFLLVLIAIILSIFLVRILLPGISSALGYDFSVQMEVWLIIFLLSLLMAVVITILAGLYPAWYLARLRPSQVFSQQQLQTGRNPWVRRGLVVVQFVISISLLAGVIVFYQQLQYMQNKPVGYNTATILALPLYGEEAQDAYETLVPEIANLSATRQVGGMDFLFANPILNDWFFYKEGETVDHAVHSLVSRVDTGFFELMDIKILAGREFRGTSKLECNSVMINQEFARKQGWTVSEAIGQKIYSDFGESVVEKEVIGVVADFHHYSLHKAIDPMSFMISSNSLIESTYYPQYSNIIIKANLDDLPGYLENLQSIWEAQLPHTPFDYIPLDDRVETLYTSDKQLVNAIQIFAAIAIIISCLGMYGLSMFSIQRRIKEIGIRKIMGAPTFRLIGMLGREYNMLIVVAFVISIPIADFVLRKWLDSFPYHINISVFWYLYAVLIAFFIAWISIGHQINKAIHINPVNILREE